MNNHETAENDKNSAKKPSKFEQILGKMPNFFEHMKKQRAGHEDKINNTETIERHITKHNQQFQEVYDLMTTEQERRKILQDIEELNCALESPFLASGQNSYFNEQIDKKGMSGLKLRGEDVEDARYIAECFGKEINFSDNELDILYAALPGTVEVNYATQTFPAIIFEDVFQCSATHKLPLPLKVGEKEEAYWSRVLSQKISETKDFPADKILEAKTRGASSTSTKTSHEELLQDLSNFEQLADKFYCPDIESMYQNPNFTSEYGVAIYGKIQTNDLEYVEVDRKYDIIQRKALQAGLKVGDNILLS